MMPSLRRHCRQSFQKHFHQQQKRRRRRRRRIRQTRRMCRHCFLEMGLQTACFLHLQGFQYFHRRHRQNLQPRLLNRLVLLFLHQQQLLC